MLKPAHDGCQLCRHTLSTCVKRLRVHTVLCEDVAGHCTCVCVCESVSVCVSVLAGGWAGGAGGRVQCTLHMRLVHMQTNTGSCTVAVIEMRNNHLRVYKQPYH